MDKRVDELAHKLDGLLRQLVEQVAQDLTTEIEHSVKSHVDEMYGIVDGMQNNLKREVLASEQQFKKEITAQEDKLKRDLAQQFQETKKVPKILQSIIVVRLHHSEGRCRCFRKFEQSDGRLTVPSSASRA